MVGWGGLPNFTEFNVQGQIVYDAQLPTGENSYRVYREPWAAQPTELPRIVAKSVNLRIACRRGAVCRGPVEIHASWNGATTVSFWQVSSGSNARHLKPVSTKPKAGFETVVQVPPANFFQVRALSASGKVLATSRVLRPS
jgi:hypothetical protein